MEEMELIKACYADFLNNKDKYNKMYEYYKGNTDALENYKLITNRANNKVRVNYIKKFIKEEVSYVLGNRITYLSKSGNSNLITAIKENLAHWSEKHDQNLLKHSLIFGEDYELYYIDDDGRFSSVILKPTECYVLKDSKGIIQLAIHEFKGKFDKNTYVDVYLKDRILHFKQGITDQNLTGEDPHYFGEVPISACPISEEKEEDTLYQDLKGLQDSYETNLSDISNEITDFRSAYLKITGAKLEEGDLEKMKELGIMQVPKDGLVDWLIKNINDSFIQNTLNTLEDKMYQISNHINANEKLSSNTSSLALRTRLISLENICSLNSDAVTDCIKNRIKFLFKFLEIKKSVRYDYLDVKCSYTPNIPQDDVMTAQIIQQLGDKLSIETGLSQLSFIDNPTEEIKKIEKEQETLNIGQELLNRNTNTNNNGGATS